MRRAICAAMVALSATNPASARSGGEVPLHIEAVGEALPNIVTLAITQQAQSSTQALAYEALARQHDDLVRRLGELGIASGDIVWVRDELPSGGSSDMMTDETGSKSPLTFYASATATITLRDAAKLAALMAVLSAMPESPTVSPRSIRYSFSDERAAREQAIQRGFAKAQQDAEAYAAATHMKIGRIERLSNAKAPVSAMDMQQFVSKIIGMIDEKSFARDAFSGVTASVVVDYVLTP